MRSFRFAPRRARASAVAGVAVIVLAAAGAAAIACGGDGDRQQQAMDGHDQQQAMDGHDQQQAMDGHDQQQAMAGHDQQQAMAGHDQQQAMDGHDQQQAMAGHDQQQAMAGHDQQQAMDGHDQQQAMDGHDQQQAMDGHGQQHAAAAGTVHPQPDGTTRVDVTLQEWSISPANIRVEAGRIYFYVDNDGPDHPHEFVIIRIGDTAIADIPVVDGSVPEDEVDFIDEIEEFGVDSAATIVVDLEPGRYLVLCNIAETEDGEPLNHYELGMRALLNVS